MDAAWPGRSSSRVTSMAAMPAAHAMGFPPKVVEWMIGLGTRTSQISPGAMKADSGITPAADRLADAHDVGDDTGVVHAPEAAGPAHAGLDLVGDQQRPERRAELTYPRQVVRRRHDAAGLPLHRLDDERGDRCADLVRLGQLGLEGIRVAIGHEPHVLQPAEERLPEGSLPHERKAAHRLAVKPTRAWRRTCSAGCRVGRA